MENDGFTTKHVYLTKEELSKKIDAMESLLSKHSTPLGSVSRIPRKLSAKLEVRQSQGRRVRIKLESSEEAPESHPKYRNYKSKLVNVRKVRKTANKVKKPTDDKFGKSNKSKKVERSRSRK